MSMSKAKSALFRYKMGSTNQLACIDYKAPLVAKDDYRTSSYFGHRYIPDPVHFSNEPSKSYQYVCNALGRKEMAYDFKTTQQLGHPNKFKESTERNPRLNLETVHYIKNYDENCLNAAHRPVKCNESIYATEYTPKEMPEDSLTLNWMCPPRMKKSKVDINAALPSASKYLDLLATTNMLTYTEPRPDQTLSKNDGITLWNWLGLKELKGGLKRELPENFIMKEETLCQKYPAQDCPVRKEYRRETKHIPHRGLTSEARSNYTLPESKVDFHYENVAFSNLYTTPVKLTNYSTESQMYGSKMRVQKFVDISKDQKGYVGTCRH